MVKLESCEGLWQDLIESKHVHFKLIGLVDHKQFDSACWGAILSVRQTYMENRSMRIGDRNQISFWDDALCTSHPLKKMFLHLFVFCNE
jgi:hypothetical protein